MRLTINGSELWFDVEGAGLTPDETGWRERPTLLVLHGGPGFDHTYLRAHLAPLTDVAQIVYLDQRGQGRSGRPALSTCTIEQMADDAASFVQTLGLERPVVLGHSFGGFVALTMALRHPEAVGGLILVDTAAATSDMGNAMEVLAERGGVEARDAAIRIFAGDTSDEAMVDFSRLVAPHYVHAPEHAGFMSDAMTRGILALEVAGHYFGQLAAQYDLRSDLRRIDVPSLVIVGESDWLLPPAASRAIAAGIPEAELVEIPEAGHLPFGERPTEFQEAVRRFLAGAVAARS